MADDTPDKPEQDDPEDQGAAAGGLMPADLVAQLGGAAWHEAATRLAEARGTELGEA